MVTTLSPSCVNKRTCGWTVSLCPGTPSPARIAIATSGRENGNDTSPQTSLVLPWQLYRAPRKSWGRRLSFRKSWANLQNANSHPETSATAAMSLQFWDRTRENRVWLLGTVHALNLPRDGETKPQLRCPTIAVRGPNLTRVQRRQLLEPTWSSCFVFFLNTHPAALDVELVTPIATCTCCELFWEVQESVKRNATFAVHTRVQGFAEAKQGLKTHWSPTSNSPSSKSV